MGLVVQPEGFTLTISYLCTPMIIMIPYVPFSSFFSVQFIQRPAALLRMNMGIGAAGSNAGKTFQDTGAEKKAMVEETYLNYMSS